VENFDGVFNGYSFLNRVGQGCLQRTVINVEADTSLHLKKRVNKCVKLFFNETDCRTPFIMLSLCAELELLDHNIQKLSRSGFRPSTIV